MGTGQVYSVQQTRFSIANSNDDIVQVRCQIALRVQLPGRPPYDATIRQLVDMFAMPELQPGATAVVAADSANPQNVRIDFLQPIRPAAPPASTSGATSGLVLPSQVRIGNSVRTDPQKPWMKVSKIVQSKGDLGRRIGGHIFGANPAFFVFHGTGEEKINQPADLRIDCLTGE